ncbi:MAG TPA: OmpA family protein, partial [Spirochaetota bacterium]|nr:OmpA family protein [Spirochaetota bacterium]
TFENEGKILADIGDTFENKILPTIVYAKYCGKSDLYGIKYDLFEINCGYKTFYDKDVSKAAGLHKIRLYFDKEAGSPVFMDDHFTEEFLLSDGKKIKKSGFYLFFYKPIIKMDKDKIISDMTGDLVVENNEFYKDLDFRKKEEGISITINNLRFKPDSTELIQEEKSKIDIMANLLKKIKNRSFLIVGHTALSGTTEERYNLSLERAKTVKDLLIERGIESQRLLYVGKGAEEPLFPNDSEENKQKNRRVEIIVLED